MSVAHSELWREEEESEREKDLWSSDQTDVN